MSRYIDKETMRGIIREQEKSHGIRGLAWIEMAMDKQENADVQEVRHGHWIEKAIDSFRKVECSCSICGWSGVDNYDSYVDIYDFEYCPRCGAKMDEEEQK